MKVLCLISFNKKEYVMAIQLYSHQKKGSQDLLTHKKWLLAWEVGTGKTYTAKDALNKLPINYKTLIIAPPKVAKKIWIMDLETGIDISERDIYVVSYKRLILDKSILTTSWDVIILDEAHKAKSTKSQISKVLRIITSKTKYVWLLTGTPIDKKYDEFYGLFNNCTFSWEGRYLAYKQFIQRWFDYTEIDYGIGIPIIKAIRVTPSKLAAFLNMLTHHCSFEKLDNCIELPGKIFKTVYIEGCNNQVYKYISKYSAIRLPNYKTTFNSGTKHTKKHQACNGFIYDDNHEPIKLCDNPKLDYLYDLIEEYDKQVIVVYYFKPDLIYLKEKFKGKDYTTDPLEFEKHKILFIQYDTGEGLNLQFCHLMIFYTYYYKYVSFDQMCGRIYRPGQKEKCVYIVLIGQNTIEQKIYNGILGKVSETEFLKSLNEDEE